jgi:2-dehydro-3-deoxygluconokinase
MPGTLEVTFAGAEANAAVTLAALGGTAQYVTALPRNEIADACCAALRAARVDVGHVVATDQGRMGLYFVEAGAGQRAGSVLYDREASSFCLAGPEAYDWTTMLRGAGWFHTSGISASVSRAAAAATIAAVQAARAADLPVSFDVNYRRKLWRWDGQYAPGELARRILEQILPAVDLLIGNAADLAHAAGLAEPAAGESGAGDLTAPLQLARALVEKYPRVRRVAITLRETVSATHHRWGALLYDADAERGWSAPTTGGAYAPHDLPQIVDRLGTGDAFAGALIYALLAPELAAPETAVRFAVAASCLAHSIQGDFSFVTRAEVEALMAGNNGGGVSR